MQIAALGPNREAILGALSPLGRLGDGVAGGQGAIYFWAQLPPQLQDDEAVVAWLIKHAGVCIIPGEGSRPAENAAAAGAALARAGSSAGHGGLEVA